MEKRCPETELKTKVQLWCDYLRIEDKVSQSDAVLSVSSEWTVVLLYSSNGIFAGHWHQLRYWRVVY